MKKIVNQRSAFTLIELLLVIAVIVALAVTVFVALNPAQRLSQARDARRTADVDAILTATHEYIMDNKGTVPANISTTDTMIGKCGSAAPAVSKNGCVITANTTCFDASTTLSAYLASAPMDPATGTASTTYYAISASTSTGIVTVKACAAELISPIQSSR